MGLADALARHCGETWMKTRIAGIGVVLGTLAGCASVAVTDSAIEERTAFALGLQRGSFTVSERRDDGVRTQYVVLTKAGQRYNCYVTGTFSVTGRIVSDAVCNKPGEAPKNPLLGR
jgi:hypothetical protein